MTLSTTMDWVAEARRQLLGLRRGPGVWGYHARSSPASEPSALAGLALLATDGDDRAGGRLAALATARWLASTRRPDGSLSVSADLPESGWPTPLGLLLWAALGDFEAERSAALGWLIKRKGETVPRTKGDPVGHDPTLVGWPWVAGTHSWVEPTAMALLAMGREGRASHPRAVEGARMLVDRAISGGGWNLGNPTVFGKVLRPMPEPSGLALLAMTWTAVTPDVVRPAMAYLNATLAGTLAPISLGWGLLGLRAWGAPPPDGPRWLASAFEAVSTRAPGAAELALLLLAVAGDRSLELLGITPRSELTRP
jgi:hypothetical protein